MVEHFIFLPDCADGYVWDNPSYPQECIRCSPGQITKNNACLDCPPGEIPNEDKTVCEKCPCDTYEELANDDKCSNCPEQSKSPEGSDDLRDCGTSLVSCFTNFSSECRGLLVYIWQYTLQGLIRTYV